MLDLVISRSDDNIIDSMTVPLLFFDHAVIHSKLVYKNPDSRKKVITYRKWKSVDKDNFANDLKQSELIQNSESDLELLVNRYDNIVRNIVDIHAPIK